ncbi:MAG TPA: RNA polymerase sigma factor [Symbiobacteriaceae bacterium]|nr:RNA polymerase sigma factor [Symbiobacteriaceae bacterium]
MRATDDRFLTLLRTEQGKLLRIARALTGQEADAWDMVQETTLVAYDRFAELRGGDEAFGPWIRTILVNRTRNLLKARSRTIALEAPTQLELEADPVPGPEQQLNHRLLWDEVMLLEEHHRQVLVLRYLVDMPVEAIAELLDVPAGTIKSRIHRALGALRKRLERDGKEPLQA